jgi:hypothetical protein
MLLHRDTCISGPYLTLCRYTHPTYNVFSTLGRFTYERRIHFCKHILDSSDSDRAIIVDFSRITEADTCFPATLLKLSKERFRYSQTPEPIYFSGITGEPKQRIKITRINELTWKSLNVEFKSPPDMDLEKLMSNSKP